MAKVSAPGFSPDPTSPYHPSHLPTSLISRTLRGRNQVLNIHSALSTVGTGRAQVSRKDLLYLHLALTSTHCSLCLKLLHVHSLNGETEAQRGEGVHWFPIAAVTTYHGFTALNQHIYLLLQLWRSEVQNSSHWLKSRYQ